MNFRCWTTTPVVLRGQSIDVSADAGVRDCFGQLQTTVKNLPWTRLLSRPHHRCSSSLTEESQPAASPPCTAPAAGWQSRRGQLALQGTAGGASSLSSCAQLAGTEAGDAVFGQDFVPAAARRGGAASGRPKVRLATPAGRRSRRRNCQSLPRRHRRLRTAMPQRHHSERWPPWIGPVGTCACVLWPTL